MSLLSPFEMSALWLSLKVAFMAMLFIVPFGLWLAYWLHKSHVKGKALIESLLYAPMVLPPVVIGYLLLVFLNSESLIGRFLDQVFGFSFAYNWLGAALAAFIMALPLFVRTSRASFDQIDPHLPKVAQTLGASNFRIFRTIYLPLSLPGVLAAGVLAFARAMGEFGATITFVSNIPELTQTLPLALYQASQIPGQENAAFRLMALSILISLSVIFISHYWLEKRHLGQSS